MSRINQIKARLSNMHLMYDTLFSDRHLIAEYDTLAAELAALERGEVYKPFVPNYAAGNLESARCAIRGWIDLAKNSRDRVAYAWGMTEAQHEANLGLARRNIARQWAWYRAAFQQTLQAA